MKLRLALLAVPFLALACSDTEQPEALTNPPAPSFAHAPTVDLGNGCIASPVEVTTRRGGREVVGTDGPDLIDCSGYNLPGSKGVRVKAGDGNDLIIGSPRDDHLSGGKGCDRVEGDGGNDVVDGGQGNDSPPGQEGCQVVDHDNGSVVLIDAGLFGQAGDDEMKGGMGRDFMDGGAGTNTCEGGKDNDVGGFVNCDVCGDPEGDCP